MCLGYNRTSTNILGRASVAAVSAVFRTDPLTTHHASFNGCIFWSNFSLGMLGGGVTLSK